VFWQIYGLYHFYLRLCVGLVGSLAGLLHELGGLENVGKNLLFLVQCFKMYSIYHTFLFRLILVEQFLAHCDYQQFGVYIGQGPLLG